jgi:hypothetical protein
MKRVLALLLLIVAPVAVAQDAATLITQAQTPAPVNSFEANGGHKFGFGGETNEDYYRVSYAGSLVTSQGTPFTEAKSLDITEQPTSNTGDRNKLDLRIEHGTATLGGTLFSGEGVQPLNLTGLDRLQLRGTAFIGGLTHDKLQFAAGLETKPYRFPGFAKTQASNWIVFGFSGQRQEDPNSTTGDKNFALGTYRAFVGKSFGYRKPGDLAAAAEHLSNLFLKAAPTLADAQKVRTEIEKIAATKRSYEQQLFVDTVIDTSSPDDWVANVRADVAAGLESYNSKPTISVYGESSGWYTFDGSGSDKNRFRNLLTFTIDYWLVPTMDNVALRLRYENGYERATPTDHKNHLLLSAVLRF